MNQLAMCRRRAGVSALLSALVLAAVGCDGLLDTGREVRTSARIQVSGTSPVPLILMTSDQFLGVQDPTTGQIVTQILVADSLIIDRLPVDTTYSLGQYNRFLVRLINPDTAATALVRMIIRLDDEEEVYDVEARVTGAYIEYTYYTF